MHGEIKTAYIILNGYRNRAHQAAEFLACHRTYPRHLNVLVFCIYCIVYEVYLEIKHIIWQEVSFIEKLLLATSTSLRGAAKISCAGESGVSQFITLRD